MHPSSRTRSLALVALVLALAGCSREEPRDPLADELARTRTAAHASKGNYGAARAELAPLVAREDAAIEDLLSAAAIEFALGGGEAAAAAQGFLARAAELEPASPAMHYLRGQLAREAGDFEVALGEFQAAHAAAPEDLATRYFLASILHDLDRPAEAEPHYRALVDLGIEQAGNYHVAALYRLERLLIEAERDDEANALSDARQALAAAGVQAASEQVLRLGTFGQIRPPAPSGNLTAPTTEPPSFEAHALELPALAGALELHAHDLDGDGRMDLLARTPAGLVIALNAPDGWSEERIADSSCERALAFELDNLREGGWLELALTRGSELRVLTCASGAWREAPGTVPALPAPPSDLVAVNFDHEADLDLLVVGPFGARLFRNDGADREGGAWSDASAEGSLPSDVAYAWCSSEDFDNDNDVDLIAGGAAGTWIGDSLRRGLFADASARLGAQGSIAAAPVLADFDGDARPDFWIAGEPATFLRQRADGSFEAIASAVAVPEGAALVDLDLDGAGDLAWDGAALLAAGLPQERLTSFAGFDPSASTRAFAFADFDGDSDVDAVRVDGSGATLFAQRDAPGHGRLVRLVGVKDNLRAVGAVLEVRAREIYRRIYWRGEQELVGLGSHEAIDDLRIRWPNGVVQDELDVPIAGEGDFVQAPGQAGSCPFLYAWNGSTFGFISDVLGNTPLGLPLAPGAMVPPDHDEYVLVRGDQLVPRDGKYVLQFTEELREVSYLDRARLEVVDHPVGTEVFPNELFCFPPFPEPHTHSLRDPLVPQRALGSDGNDWTSALAAIDDVHATPFVRERDQLFGIAEPWWLELEFDRERLARARKLRLVMTGWFRWSDASVNMAIARMPGVRFVPPILELAERDAQDVEHWVPTGPPLGFPAGKPKTMVVDISHLLPRLAQDPRLRLSTTLQLCWDRIALAVDDDDAELRVTSLEPLAARLWERGFSAALPVPSVDVPERFDWDALHPLARWDQHPGMYTKHGECRELMLEVDDRFAILGAGDALTLEFDAQAVPPLAEGFTRDYLLYLDGWAKDRDPNTLEALTVEPLPFHGMSGYPYRADERYPDDEEHERYRAEWNTRPQRRWIEPLSPLAGSVPTSSSW